MRNVGPLSGMPRNKRSSMIPYYFSGHCAAVECWTLRTNNISLEEMKECCNEIDSELIEVIVGSRATLTTDCIGLSHRYV
jgi:hypothetical protein